jgi:hypothetical protein
MNITKSFAITFLILSLALAASGVTSLTSHRYHTSLTRMDYNAKEKIIETSIQIFTHDLVPLLEEKNKKRIDLEKTADVDKLIFNYLSENFILKDNKGEAKKIKWVGKELDVDTARIYVEISSDKSPEGPYESWQKFDENYDEAQYNAPDDDERRANAGNESTATGFGS